MQFPEIVSMVSAGSPRPGRRQASLAALERDAALQRVSRTRRWMIGAVAALSAGITALVSSVAPGHTLKKNANARELTTSGTATQARTATRMPPLATPSDLGLQGPSSPPHASSAPSASTPAPTQSAAPDNSRASAPPAPAPSPAPAPAVSGGS
jgi:peptidoglycan DL-endopeptidase CwlO